MSTLSFSFRPRAIALFTIVAGLAAASLTLFFLLDAGLLTATDGTWQSIQERGTWRVGMDPSFPPFEMLDESGRPVGYDVDLAQAIADRWGVEIEIVAIGFDGLIDALQVGKIDGVISAMPLDPRLTQDVRFTSSYFEAGTRLAVPAGSDIDSVEDLAGRTVAVEWGSAGDGEARKLRRSDPTILRLPLPTPDEAVDALLAGKSDALIVDGVTLRLAQGQGADLVAVGPALESDPYVVAVPYQARTLHEAVEQALTELAQNGTLDDLEQRWFSVPD